LGYLAGSFLLFRGALMTQDSINDWSNQIGQEYVHLSGTTNTSKNLEIALEDSKCNRKYEDGKQAVLFVYSITNYEGFQGFRLNDDRYTPFS